MVSMCIVPKGQFDDRRSYGLSYEGEQIAGRLEPALNEKDRRSTKEYCKVLFTDEHHQCLVISPRSEIINKSKEDINELYSLFEEIQDFDYLLVHLGGVNETGV